MKAPRRDILAVDTQPSLSGRHFDLKLRFAAVFVRDAARPQARCTAPDQARGLFGAERAAAGQEPDRLQQGGLALGVAADKYVQPGR